MAIADVLKVVGTLLAFNGAVRLLLGTLTVRS